ncbi:MAG TPA: DoxX family membrane protein [Propionibacteriaceae bacterium]
MTLLRAAARTMLASYFVVSGIKAVRDPGPLVPAAEPVADRFVPMIKQYAPAQVAGYIPEDAKTLVRVNGAVQLLGGLALASGKGRRVGSLLLAGSLIPSTIAKHPFWTREDADEKALDKAQFIKNVSLVGGVLLAAGDTEGQPSIAWRAQKGGQAIAKSTGKATDKIAKKASALTDGGGSDFSDFADTALAGGAALVGTVVATSRKASKAAGKQLKEAQAVAAKQTEEARKAAARAAKQAKKDAPKQLAAAKKFAAEQAVIAKKIATEQAEAARKAAKQAKKDAPKQLAAAKKQARKVGKNIELGHN